MKHSNATRRELRTAVTPSRRAAIGTLLTLTAIGYGLQLVSLPSDLGVVAGVALLAMTISAWWWLAVHVYHTWRSAR